MASKKRAHERERPHYTEAQRIKAVTAILQCEHGRLSIEAQQQARIVLGADVSTTTLARWIKQYQPLIETTDKSLIAKPLDIPELITSTREIVIKNLNIAVNKMSARINTDDAINGASLRDLSVSMGISIEKILLLAGRSPELDSTVTTLQSECQGTEYNPITLIEDVINAVRLAKNNRKPTIDIENNDTTR